MHIYITYCSESKSSSREKLSPFDIYTSPRIRGFMRQCRKQGVRWAVFSDEHGILMPNEKIHAYDKPPRSVTKSEFHELLKNFDDSLRQYDEI